MKTLTQKETARLVRDIELDKELNAFPTRREAQPAHSPLPWKMQKPIGKQHAIDRKWEIVAPLPEGGEMVIVGEHTGIECLNEQNAKLIVRAVNAMPAAEAMAEALETAKRTLNVEGHTEGERAFAVKKANAALNDWRAAQ